MRLPATTPAAVIEDGRKLRSCVIYSQIQEHKKFGGVVPEIASRSHLVKINGVFGKALEDAGVNAGDLSYAAVTSRPGLTGSLMIGGMLAKCLELAPEFQSSQSIISKRICMLRLCTEARPAMRPWTLLRIRSSDFCFQAATRQSSLCTVRGVWSKLQIRQTTRSAKLSTRVLQYSAWVILAAPLWKKQHNAPAGGEPIFHKLLRDEAGLLFSFSGIKTAVIRAKEKGHAAEAICRDFQATVFELVERMILRAAEQTGIRRVVASGGVLANGALRRRLDTLRSRQIDVSYPS